MPIFFAIFKLAGRASYSATLFVMEIETLPEVGIPYLEGLASKHHLLERLSLIHH